MFVKKLKYHIFYIFLKLMNLNKKKIEFKCNVILKNQHFLTVKTFMFKHNFRYFKIILVNKIKFKKNPNEKKTLPDLFT